jgi:hypothetical protein
MLTTLRRTLRALLKGTLDDGAIVALLGGSLLVAVVAAIVLVAIDPAVRGFGSVPAMQLAADPAVREKILGFWAAHQLLRRTCAFLWVDAAAFLPACALFLAAFLRHFERLLQADGTPPTLFGRPLPWKWLVLAPLLALAAGVVADLASLYALRLAGEAALPAWLHFAIRAAGCAKVALFAAAALVALWLFAAWFFKILDSPRAQVDTADERARLRAAVFDMLWRSKYAVLVLVLYGVLVLGMDQTRDALVRQIADADNDLATLAGVVITLVALALLARASWLWPRLVLRLRSPGWPRDFRLPARAEAFGRWWSRILGVAPFVFVALAIATAIHDVPADSPVILWFALALALVIVLAAAFLYRVSTRRRRAPLPYYGGVHDGREARADMGWLPFWVAAAPPLVFLLARFVGLYEGTPPLALAVITAGLAAWAGVLGWVAYESRRAAIPYFLAVLLVVAVLGICDLTDAHRVRVWSGEVEPLDPAALRRLFGVTAILAAIGLALAWLWWFAATTLRARVVSGVLAIAAVAGVIALYDRDPGAPAATDARLGVEEALGRWLKQLHADLAPRRAAASGAGRQPVFLISAEGGGIRSAYWTAAVLARMRADIDGFDRRTFAIAGVSGGALGVAAYRACGLAAEARAEALKQCIDRVGYADLWTQLLGGALFEDVLATVVPSAWCKLPGCGVLGRSYWFEGALESAAPSLARGLAGAGGGARGTPHLFLTATRVETGERAIQSEIATGPRHFPGAVDVLAMTRADVPLSTAAHNSARFPFTNPAGAVYGPHCPERPDAPAARSAAGKARLCARIEDGGYFDNSSALTTADVARALRGCLAPHGRCGLTEGEARDLRGWIAPVVIALRNEERFDPGPGAPPPLPCAPPSDPRRDPAVPRKADPLRLVPTLLSAPLTLYNTREAHMRFADALVEREAGALWADLGLAVPEGAPQSCGKVSEWIGARPMVRFDLVVDERLYPSGWMLSKQAMEGIYRQATRNVP